MMFSSVIKIRMVLVTWLMPLLATSQIFPHHLKEDKLTGKVKQVAIITNDETREMFMYNEKGWQTERWFFKPIEVLDHRYKAVYNEKGQLVEETMFSKGIAPVMKYVYGYDAKGLKIGRSLFSENNTLLEKYIYQYDAAKRMTDSIRVDQYSNILEKRSWQFDKMGRKLTQTSFNNADSSFFTIEYTYNASGKLSAERSIVNGVLQKEVLFTYKGKEEERRYFNEKKKLASLYKYDSSKNLTSIVSFAENGKPDTKLNYVFDRSGNMVEETKTDTAGVITSHLVYKYDKRKNKTEVKRYFGSKLDITMTWQYEYDKTGNWIKAVSLVDGLPIQTIKREIEYY